MADADLTGLTAATTLDDDDLLYALIDPSGTPLDRKITVGNARALLGMPDTSGGTLATETGYSAAAKGGFRLGILVGPPDTSVSISEGYVKGVVTYIRQTTFDRVMMHSDTAKSAGGTVDLVVYNLSSALTPTTLVDSRQLAADGAAGDIIWTVTSWTISAGWYFLGLWNPADTFGSFVIEGATSSPIASAPADPDWPGNNAVQFNVGGTTVPTTLVGETPSTTGDYPTPSVILA